MEMEQWLEDAMVVTNKSLRLMPSRVLKECLDSCRKGSGSLVALVGAGSQLGVVDRATLQRLKERIPEPLAIRPNREELLALKETHQAGVEAARFWVNYFIGATREMPAAVNFRSFDERSAHDFHRVLHALVGQTTRCDGQEEQKEASDGNSDSN